jgi:hypothetical protein
VGCTSGEVPASADFGRVQNGGFRGSDLGDPVRRLKTAQALCYDATERAAFVAAQVALLQSGENGRAIERRKLLVPAGTGLVNRLSNHFLACTRFSWNEDAVVR